MLKSLVFSGSTAKNIANKDLVEDGKATQSPTGSGSHIFFVRTPL